MNIFNRINQFVLGFLILIASFTLLAQSQEQTPASVQGKSELIPFTQAELEQVLAPIALYPDTVLSHILIASTYPLEVIQAERWTLKNSDYKGSDAVEAVTNKDWDPSVKALTAFPEILTRLSENLEWTQKLGDAFLQDEEKLLASVQALRQRAYANGNLDKMDKMNVTVEDDSSIVIEPREREVVYVPYYDTRVVYGSWYWANYPPVYWSSPHYANRYNSYNSYNSPFYWGSSIRVSYGYFFNSFLWNERHIVRIPYNDYSHQGYYGRQQIASHRQARRWSHNPVHRRGVSYRSVTVSNRYRADNVSHRPSQNEVRSHRNRTYSTRNSTVRNSTGRNSQAHNSTRSPSTTRERNLDRRIDNAVSNSTNHNSTRIATPNRIREELRDGRISIRERNTRPPASNHNKPSTRARVQKPSVISEKPNRQTSNHSSPVRQEIVRPTEGDQTRSSNSNSSNSNSSNSNSTHSNSSRSSRTKDSGSNRSRSSSNHSSRSSRGSNHSRGRH